jgi:polynucleotide 5'-hydroxyl-kinase GRC3/NOL9
MILGAPDTGKTTLTRFMVEELSRRGERVAYIDGDIGQSIIGPPTTQGMAVFDEPWVDLETVPLNWAYFVGSTSPRGHGRETLVGLKKLLEKSLAGGAQIAILDTTGYVTGEDAVELKYQKIDLIDPSHIVAVQSATEIEHILRPQEDRGKAVLHRFSSPPGAYTRSPEERRRYRWNRFQEYFGCLRLYDVDLNRQSLTGTHRLKIDDRRQEDMEGLLLGLNGSDNFLVTLGVVENFNPRKGILSCLVPSGADLERVRTIRLGSMRIDLSEHVNGERFLGRDP